MNARYDSYPETLNHISTVRKYIGAIVKRLWQRAIDHDATKLIEPEKSMYDEHAPKFRSLTYGSAEYRQSLADMGEALNHHYKHNTHHPEHYENGINGMTLLDVFEMLADWKAVTERHADGDMQKSLLINKERFGISEQLLEILQNTIKEMEW